MIMARLSIVFAVLMSLLTANGADDGKLRTIAKGAFSGVQEQTFQVITNDAQWKDIWRKHSALKKPVTAAPEIDFDKESVVFAALGQKRTGGYAIEVVRVETAGAKTEVLLRTRAPAPGGFQLQALSAPFHIVAVPKISNPVEFKVEPSSGKTR